MCHLFCQRLLSDALRSSGPAEPWLMWCWPTSGLPICRRRQDTLCVPCVERFYHGNRPTASWRIFRRSKRCGFCPPDLPSFVEMLEDADDRLFNKINNNDEHVLHCLLPPPSVAPQHYELRQRAHNRTLPTRTGRLNDSNFINRLQCSRIFTNILTTFNILPYIIAALTFIYFIYCFFPFFICVGCGLSTSIKDFNNNNNNNLWWKVTRIGKFLTVPVCLVQATLSSSRILI